MIKEGSNRAPPEEVGDIVSLLSTDERDFLIRNNGDKVAIGSLEGKVIALYFAVSGSRPFTLRLIEVYSELRSLDNNFEIIFVTDETNEDCFDEDFSEMPWLAIPFSDTWMRGKLENIFLATSLPNLPNLVILDANGKVLNRKGVQAVKGYGSEGYPFTVEKISKLREEMENAKKDQTLRSVLVSSSRDYLIANDRSKVSVSNLEGKIVALYFACRRYACCNVFTPVFAEIYRKLKEIGESFEVVLVRLDGESDYDNAIERMPWLAFPFNDKRGEKLFCYFDLQENNHHAIILIGPDGKTMNVDLIELIKVYGFDAWEAFPFSQKKLHEFSEKEKAKLESQTLESILVSGDLDYVIGKNGLKVPIKELVGKTILLYFSSMWRCGNYLPKLVEEYHEIKNADSEFEMIYVSGDCDQDLFNKVFLRMPWLALPFGDERQESLNKRIFKIGYPQNCTLVAISPTGRIITKEAKELFMIHGTVAYPFTEERIKELEHLKEMAKGWPEKIKLDLYDEHELVLTGCFSYDCNGCREMGHNWSYRCEQCEFDLHPKCALNQKRKEDGENGEAHGEVTEEEYVYLEKKRVI
ncbi:probable nucleoredoxin 1-1 [Zingiber officinale]|uniref:protein-disulfide reductase n=1 Tax=Zingiber officinale TaxID=94328 RepID=A0A8J5F7T0_ZINOF|nr:probable nucleoredoxin 1-1 [Zingiber officinale]KAG6483116.1 hypothetical protein ZIOFF_059756 [Zingiber officinale]